MWRAMDAASIRRDWAKVLLIAVGVVGAVLAGWGVFLRGTDVLTGLGAVAGFVVVVIHPHVGLYAMLFLIPLQNLVMLGEGTTLVRVMGLSAGAAWGASKLVKKESIRPLLTGPLAASLLVFLSVAAASVSWSALHTWRRDFTTYVQLAAMVFIILDVIHSPKRLKEALFVLFLGCLISAGIIIYDSIGPSAPSYPWYRPEGGHGDPNYTASTFLTLLPVAFWFATRGEHWRWLAGGASAAFLLTAVGFTVSRTGMAAIVLLLVAYLVLLGEGRMRFLLVAMLVVLAIVPFLPWARIRYRFTAPDLSDRLIKFRHAWSILRRYPLTGGGLGRRGRRTVIFVIHNLFLEIAAQLGLPGLLSMVWLWVTAWLSLSRAYGWARCHQDSQTASLVSAIRVGALVYLLFSMTLSTHQTRMMWLVLALSAACDRIVKNLHPKVASSVEAPGNSNSLGPTQCAEAG